MMPANESSAPVSVLDFARWKSESRKITMLTAYDFHTAKFLDEAGVDCLLVGDSLGTAFQGWSTTLKVTLDQMIYHTEMVARASQRAMVVSDLPFLSYQASIEQAVLSAGRVFKETEAHAVKLEGGQRSAATIRALVETGMPVMGHIGLTPQSIRSLGGYKVQRDEDTLRADALAVEAAGAFAVVLECVPEDIARVISAELKIPTIGIGAGVACDGQVLVTPDLLGLIEEFKPKFARRYSNLGEIIRDAARRYVSDVRNGQFPSTAESYRSLPRSGTPRTT